MTDKPMELETVRELASHFCIEGAVTGAVAWGSGHINDTYAVTYRGAPHPRYIYQRVNHQIFKDVPRLMENVQRVTEHVRSKLAQVPGADPERETLTVVPTRDGAPCHCTPDGDFWRIYLFVEGARTYDVPEHNGQIHQAARAFGRFQALLADLPGDPLHETIVNFHHTPTRFATLEQSIAADAHGRAGTCGPEIEFALGLASFTGRIVDGMDAGVLSRRVTHNDTKINNVMIDDATGEGLCVIDLDTVMPGSPLYDFGDQVRTATGHFQENEKDLSKVYVDTDRFEQLVKGYLATARQSLNNAEIERLWLGGVLMTFECGIRFLADYLQGDVYFRTHYADENLDRCRTQFAHVRSMQANERAMREIVETYR